MSLDHSLTRHEALMLATVVSAAAIDIDFLIKHSGRLASKVFSKDELAFAGADIRAFEKFKRDFDHDGGAASKPVKKTHSADVGLDPYEAAKSGGKHSGWYKSYKNKSANELNKSIKSFEKQIKLHEDKIANPTKYVSDWDVIRDGHRQNLINGWYSDIARHKEQPYILRAILKTRS